MPFFLKWFPESIVGAGHFVCALSGAALLFVSYGLERRLASAFKFDSDLDDLRDYGRAFKRFRLGNCHHDSGGSSCHLPGQKTVLQRTSFWEDQISLHWALSVRLLLLPLFFFLAWFLLSPIMGQGLLHGVLRKDHLMRQEH